MLAAVAMLVCVCVVHGGSFTASKLEMRVAVFSIPFLGHYYPLKSLAEQLSQRGHRVTIFTETPSWCESSDVKFDSCRILAPANAFPSRVFEEMSAFEEHLEGFGALFAALELHHKKVLPQYLAEIEKMKAEGLCCGSCFDLVLTDSSTWAGFSVATKLNVPHVTMFPLVMHMVNGPGTYLPSMGTGFPQKMSFLQRFVNFLQLRSSCASVLGATTCSTGN